MGQHGKLASGHGGHSHGGHSHGAGCAQTATCAAQMGLSEEGAGPMQCPCQRFLTPGSLATMSPAGALMQHQHAAAAPHIQHFCKVCNIQLNSCRQAKVHSEGKKHVKRLQFLQMCAQEDAQKQQTLNASMPHALGSLPLFPYNLHPLAAQSASTLFYAPYLAAAAAASAGAFPHPFSFLTPTQLLDGAHSASNSQLFAAQAGSMFHLQQQLQQQHLGMGGSNYLLPQGHALNAQAAMGVSHPPAHDGKSAETSSMLSLSSSLRGRPTPRAASTSVLRKARSQQTVRQPTTQRSAACKNAAVEHEIRCEVCQVSVNSSQQLQSHITGHKHRSRLRRFQKLEEQSCSATDSDCAHEHVGADSGNCNGDGEGSSSSTSGASSVNVKRAPRLRSHTLCLESPLSRHLSSGCLSSARKGCGHHCSTSSLRRVVSQTTLNKSRSMNMLHHAPWTRDDEDDEEEDEAIGGDLDDDEEEELGGQHHLHGACMEKAHEQKEVINEIKGNNNSQISTDGSPALRLCSQCTKVSFLAQQDIIEEGSAHSVGGGASKTRSSKTKKAAKRTTSCLKRQPLPDSSGSLTEIPMLHMFFQRLNNRSFRSRAKKDNSSSEAIKDNSARANQKV